MWFASTHLHTKRTSPFIFSPEKYEIIIAHYYYYSVLLRFLFPLFCRPTTCSYTILLSVPVQLNSCCFFPVPASQPPAETISLRNANSSSYLFIYSALRRSVSGLKKGHKALIVRSGCFALVLRFVFCLFSRFLFIILLFAVSLDTHIRYCIHISHRICCSHSLYSLYASYRFYWLCLPFHIRAYLALLCE